MKVEMYDKNGLILKTKEKFCTEDIEVIPSFPTESGNNLQLYPPNVSIVDQDFAVIEDPDNGLFATSWRLYANERLIDNNADKDTRIDLTAFFGENGDFTLQAKSFSERFLPSNFSEPVNYIRVVFTEGLDYDLDQLDDYAICAGIGTATGPYIAIAQTYRGYPVVAVGHSAFEGNMDITGVYIPEGVKEIQSAAFKNCYALETVTLPATLEVVNSNAFFMDIGDIFFNPAPPSRLSRVNYLGTIEQWSQIAIYSSPLEYADTLYINGRKLTEAIVLPNEITQIADGAFQYFKVPSITIPDSVTSIGWDAFRGCSSEIIWGGTPRITGIGTNVFAYYRGQSITIPDSVIGIGPYAFIGSSLVEITIPLSPGLRIGRYAFTRNQKLTTVNFVGNTYAGSIAEWAFSDCSSLVEITIPVLADSPINIGDSCFRDCYKLEKIIFSKNADLGNEVFQNCSNLLLVDFRNATKVAKLGTNVFPVSNYKIVVPNNLYDEWILAENWSTYADRITKASEYVEP